MAYSKESKAYEFFFPQATEVSRTQDVVFWENKIYNISLSSPTSNSRGIVALDDFSERFLVYEYTYEYLEYLLYISVFIYLAFFFSVFFFFSKILL